MKDRTKCILLFFSLVIIIFLAIYIIKRTPKCDRIHADEMIAFDVPDADIAKQIADVVMDIGEDKDYDVNVDFDEKSNEWIIVLPSIQRNVLLRIFQTCQRIFISAYILAFFFEIICKII